MESLQEELRQLADQSLYRRCRKLENVRGVRAILDGKEITLFCGNDYLGLSQHAQVIEAAKAAAADGTGSGAARLISGTTAHHVALEEKIAEFKHAERALVYSTGYMANLGVLTALAGKEDLIVMDKLSHASLVDGARLSGAELRVFPHKNYERCEEILSKSENFRRRLLVTDSVFSMDGDLADLPQLVRIKEKHNAMLVIDDAHGTGVIGKSGRGAAEHFGLENKIDVTVGTLSKAVGCLGGFAAGSSKVIEYLINTSRSFIFATSLPPMVCAAAKKALETMDSEPQLRENLWKNAGNLHAALAQCGFELNPLDSPIIPIFIGDEKKSLAMSEELLKKGMLVPAIRTPTVAKGKARLRLTVSARHTPAHFDALKSALKESKVDGLS